MPLMKTQDRVMKYQMYVHMLYKEQNRDFLQRLTAEFAWFGMKTKNKWKDNWISIAASF